MRIVRWSDLTPAPWKNGGGETVEIASAPDGASMDSFDWRLSAATVASDGPFSIFPDIDRTLCVLTGEGLHLRIEGRPAQHLDGSSAPFSFPGDIPVFAALTGGAVRDFNVMTRRGRVAHRVSRLRADTALTIPCDGGLVALFVVSGEHEAGDKGAVLGRFDTALHSGDPLAVRPRQAGEILCVDLTIRD